MYFDIHAHMYKYPFPISRSKKTGALKPMFPTGEQLTAMHDALGIGRAVILPVVSPEVYVPQSLGEVIEFANASGGRFIPFCNLDPRVIANENDTDLGFLIEYYVGQGCKGMGEVMPNMEFFDLKMQNLFYHCERAGLPLLFDCSGNRGHGYGLYDDAGLPQIGKALAKYPDLTFIGHGPAFWADYDAIDPREKRTLWATTTMRGEGVVWKYMREYGNLMIDLSAGSGYCAMTRDREYAARFLNEFWDRILFGTDLCYYEEKPAGTLIGLLDEFRDTGVLSEEKYQAIAHGNAEKLLKV